MRLAHVVGMRTVLSLRFVWACLMFFAGPAISASAQTPLVRVTNVVTMVTEPNSVADFLIIKDSGSEATVNFEILGSAVEGVDYVVVGSATSVTIPSDANVAMVRVEVLDDFLVEPEKTIILHLLPGAGYAIGTPQSATVTLRSDDPVYTEQTRFTFEPALSGFDPPVVAPNTRLTLTVVADPFYRVGSSASVFLDSRMIGGAKYPASESYFPLSFQLPLTSPAPGLHLVTAVFTKTNAGSQIVTQPIRVADAILQPASQGSISNATSVDTLSLNTRAGTDPGTSGAFLEFPVPTGATNWKAALFLSGGDSGRLYAYRGNGVVTADDAAAEAELVTSFTVLGNSQVQFDVTRWTQTNAGGYIGFKFQRDPLSAGGTLYGPVLAFFSSSNDVPTNFRWRNYPAATQFVDQMQSFDLEIYDADSRITNIRVFKEVQILPATNLVQTNIVQVVVDLPAGRTNFVSIPWTNATAGTHSLKIEVATEDGTTTHSYYFTLYPAAAGAPVHRWLGTDGESKSFYVVDAAGRAWVWGDNNNGQLGLGFRGHPVTRPALLPRPPGKKWRQFTSALFYAVGVTDDGAVYGMGQNLDGPSLFTTENPNVPIALPMVSSRFARRAGLTQAALWIINESSQLIQIGQNPSFSNLYTDLETGGYHLLALDSSGRLLYGPNSVGEYSTFDAPTGSAPWNAFSTCLTHSLALDAKGRLFAWGQNTSGQLPFAAGISPQSPQLTAFPFGVTAWTKVAAGKNVSLAVDLSGKLFSWGQRGYTGSAEPYVPSKIVPVAVPPDELGWLDVAVGSNFAMALSASGNLYVWGDLPGSPTRRHVDFPELVPGLPELLKASAAIVPAVTFEPSSVALDSQFGVDLIVPAGTSFTVEMSRDLMNWTTVTNISNALPKTTFTAPVGDDGNFFFRVR